MDKRICKVCKEEKIFEYFTLNTQSRSIYKDDAGNIWHGRCCYSCFSAYVKKKSGKKPLGNTRCEVCDLEVPKKAHRQRVCSPSCYEKLST